MAAPASEYVRVDVVDNHPLDQNDNQEQHDRRNVDATHIGQHGADRTQHRLGYAVKEIPDHRHELVARIDHVEGDQPRQYRRRDDDIDVKVQHDEDDVEE